MTRTVLAFDTGPGSGLGHQRRMEALARALHNAGVSADLASADDDIEADLVVVDSYRHRADDRRQFRGRVIAGVDDLRRDLATDLLIDPNPGASDTNHPAAGRVLAGPTYALLDPALEHAVLRPIGPGVPTALVAAGAADTDGAAARMAAALRVLLPATRIRLAVGPWGTQDVPDGVEAVRTSEGLDAELGEADLVITAGGVTMLEAMVLGRPTVAVVLADNQRQAAEAAADAGAVVLASQDAASAAAAALAGDERRRRDLSAGARRLVDGGGSRRVAEVLLAIG